MDDVSGVLLRPLIEVVLASLYGLHGGPEAHRRLCDALVRDLRKLPEGDDLAPALEAFADWEGPADRVTGKHCRMSWTGSSRHKVGTSN